LDGARSTRTVGDQSAPGPEGKMSGLRSSLPTHHRLEISVRGTDNVPTVIFFSSRSSSIARRKFEQWSRDCAPLPGWSGLLRLSVHWTRWTREPPAETKKTTGRRAKIQLTGVFASRLAMADLCVVK